MPVSANSGAPLLAHASGGKAVEGYRSPSPGGITEVHDRREAAWSAVALYRLGGRPLMGVVANLASYQGMKLAIVNWI